MAGRTVRHKSTKDHPMNFDFFAVKKAVKSLEERHLAIRNQVLELHKKTEAIRYAPAAREDVIGYVRQWVKESANCFGQTLQDSVTQLAKSPLHSNGGRLRQLVTLNGAPGTKANPASIDYGITQPEIGQALCANMGSMLLDGLLQAIEAMTWPTDALPLENRTQKIEEIGRQIAKLEAEDSSIVNQAREIGLNLE